MEIAKPDFGLERFITETSAEVKQRKTEDGYTMLDVSPDPKSVYMQQNTVPGMLLRFQFILNSRNGLIGGKRTETEKGDDGGYTTVAVNTGDFGIMGYNILRGAGRSEIKFGLNLENYTVPDYPPGNPQIEGNFLYSYAGNCVEYYKDGQNFIANIEGLDEVIKEMEFENQHLERDAETAVWTCSYEMKMNGRKLRVSFTFPEMLDGNTFNEISDIVNSDTGWLRLPKDYDIVKYGVWLELSGAKGVQSSA